MDFLTQSRFLDVLAWPLLTPVSLQQLVAKDEEWRKWAALSFEIVAGALFSLYSLYKLVRSTPENSKPPRTSFSRKVALILHGIILTVLSLHLVPLWKRRSSISSLQVMEVVTIVAIVISTFWSAIIVGRTWGKTARLIYVVCMFCATTFGSGSVLQIPPISPIAFILILFLDLESDRDPSDIAHYSLWSILTCSFLSPYVTLAHRRDVNIDDLPAMPSEKEAEQLQKRLGSSAEASEQTEAVPGINKLLSDICVMELCLSFFWELLSILAKFGTPWVLRTLLIKQDYYSVLQLALLGVTDAFATSQASYQVRNAGAKLRSVLITRIFERVTHYCRDSPGEVSGVNLIETDTQRVCDYITYIHATWSAPTQATLCIVCIGFVLSWQSALAALACLFIFVPLYLFCASRMHYWSTEAMLQKDARLLVTAEGLYNSTRVKLFAEEKCIETKLCDIREKELKCFQALMWLSGMLNVLMRTAPTIMSVGAFFAAQFVHVRLTGEKLFPSMLLFSLLTAPLGTLPLIVSMWVQSRVSYARIRTFANEVDESVSNYVWSGLRGIDLPEVKAQNMGIQLKSEPGSEKLFDLLNLQVSGPKLVTVSGPTTSGKSTLLQAVLGSVPMTSGCLSVSGMIAYQPQEPWFFDGSIKENILLGQDEEPERYKMIIRACALEHDFKSMTLGDETIVSSVGIGLSGGQKSRISLARAAYKKSDIYLLDDPLAAVDGKVHAHLIRHVLGPGGILKDSLRIVTTTSTSLVSVADLSLKIEEKALSRIQSSDAELVSIASDETTNSLPTVSDNDMKPPGIQLTVAPLPQFNDSDNLLFEEETVNVVEDSTIVSSDKSMIVADTDSFISSDVYWSWIRIAGLKRWLIVVLLMLLGWFANVASTLVLKDISESDGSNVVIDLLWYTAASAFSGIFILAWLLGAWYLCARKTSRDLHAMLAAGIFYSPLGFFQSRSVGDILNRFTNDLTRHDQALYGAVYGYMNAIIRLVATAGVIILSSPFSLCYIIPAILLCWFIQSRFLYVLVRTKRLETQSRGPVINNFQETQSGSLIISTFGAQGFFTSRHLSRLDDTIRAYVTTIGIDVWLTLRLALLAVSLQILTALLLIAMNVGQGTLGFAMSYLLQIATSLETAVVCRTRVESEAFSFKRILEYVNNEREGSEQKVHQPIPAFWPAKGSIDFNSYSASYSPSSAPVLRDVNLNISNNSNIAVIGRTGAGKSSLANALLRILEAQSGSIVIDGIDISQVDIATLRKRLTIIPQDFQLFTGTVRTNIDPGQEFDESDLLQALVDSKFSAGFASPSEALDHPIRAAESRLSGGQRQQLAIARALLQRPKIVILDEATAAVDRETETMIHQALKKCFVNSTTITIAHRLDTVLDCDKIVVLDAGGVIEEGAPRELWNRKGRFWEMIADSELQNQFEGDEMACARIERDQDHGSGQSPGME